MNKVREKWKTFGKSAISTEWWREMPDRKKGRNEEHNLKVVGRDRLFQKDGCKDRTGQQGLSKTWIIVVFPQA